MENLLVIEEKSKAVYIHIPFCVNICSYCDFCKLYYRYFDVNEYLKCLEKEIKLNYKGELIKTIYIGGGTPSCLSIEELKELFEIIKIFNLPEEIEFTFECNIENITEEKLKLLYENRVNRISIGVQTFNDKYLLFLERNHTKDEVIKKIKLVKSIGLNNINVDLMYGFENQSIEDLKKDLDEYLKLDINHISIYSLILEEHTKLSMRNISLDDDLTADMYEYICKFLKEKGYNHYEISNFSRTCYESKHNLTYWNNEEYYGFGLGASGYIDEVRYENTRSLSKYLNGQYVLEKHKLSKKECMENEMILGLRKISGVNKEVFYKKYNMNINDVFNITELLDKDYLIDDGENIYINGNLLFVSNEIMKYFID